jgi:hypothetical protein
MKGSAAITAAVTTLFTAGVAVALLARLDKVATGQRGQAVVVALAFAAASAILGLRAWRNARTTIVLNDASIADGATTIAWSEVRRVEWQRVGPYQSTSRRSPGLGSSGYSPARRFLAAGRTRSEFPLGDEPRRMLDRTGGDRLADSADALLPPHGCSRRRVAARRLRGG